jgi:hypothetical protein
VANDDSIMDLVDNIEDLYNRKNRFYDALMAKGESLTEIMVLTNAARFANRMAIELKESGYVPKRYTQKEVQQAAKELLAGFEEYRDYAIKAAAERSRADVPPPAMTPEDIEHAKKYEDLARQLGIDALVGLIPASREVVEKALRTGDQHLNSIPLWKWDLAAETINVPELSLSEKVCALKHVAKWHYA